MLAFLNRNNFFGKFQFGFTAGKSTEDALLKFCSEVYNGINKNLSTAGLFVDITKAFDMVDHELLLNKLYKAGFRGFMWKWFQSYLKDRKQKVKIGNSFSYASKMNIGVPQGSVLGPILFLIFINSVFDQDFKGNITAFADDMAFSYSSNSKFNQIVDINHDVNVLANWFSVHRLIVSNKTKLMFFNLIESPSNDIDIHFHGSDCSYFLDSHNPRCNITLNSVYSSSNVPNCTSNCFKIAEVETFKYLGIVIDKKLNWLFQIQSLNKYFLSVVRRFYHLGKFCSLKVLTMIYYGIFHSKLQYGLTCWGGAYNNKIQPLLVAQKHIIRLICKKNRLHRSFPLFQILNILPVKHLYFYKALKVFFQRGGYLNSVRYGSRFLRASARNNVNIPTFFKTCFQNFFDVTAPALYNKLPDHIREIRVLSTFLNELKIWLFLHDHDGIKNIIRVIS